MSPLPENLRHKLPPQSDEGQYHVDALLEGRWKGVLVLDDEARVVGWRECRDITCDPGDFDDHPIEDIRPPALLHRLWSEFPVDPLAIVLLGIGVINPLLLIGAIWLPRWVAWIPLGISAAALLLLWPTPRGVFIRLPAIMLALATGIGAVCVLVS